MAKETAAPIKGQVTFVLLIDIPADYRMVYYERRRTNRYGTGSLGKDEGMMKLMMTVWKDTGTKVSFASLSLLSERILHLLCRTVASSFV